MKESVRVYDHCAYCFRPWGDGVRMFDSSGICTKCVAESDRDREASRRYDRYQYDTKTRRIW